LILGHSTAIEATAKCKTRVKSYNDVFWINEPNSEVNPIIGVQYNYDFPTELTRL